MADNPQQKKALFLDRDGVINVNHGYVYRIEDFEFIDGIFEIVKEYADSGHIVIVITNQSGISRGYYGEDDFQRVTEYMINEFKKRNIEISKVYHCPDHPEFSKSWECRKPNPYMILEAQREFNIDLKNSTLIGDSKTDIEAGENAGVGRNILIKF